MFEPLSTLELNNWQIVPTPDLQQQAIHALENGQVVYLPHLTFTLHDSEKILLTPELCNGGAKNISYDLQRNKLSGTNCGNVTQALLANFMQRYASYSTQLIKNLFPCYATHLRCGRTSYRPVEIAGRSAPSIRKDDTRLHVDAFPASPVQGARILRVFTNINPHGKDRVWRTGEPLTTVINKFAPQISAPIPGSAWLLNLLKITRGARTKYDHYMLGIHNQMKTDAHYQQNCPQHEVHFSAGTSWIVYTDQVSHAAMAGQYVLEQTFYLPHTAMQASDTTPLSILEQSLQIACL